MSRQETAKPKPEEAQGWRVELTQGKVRTQTPGRRARLVAVSCKASLGTVLV